MANVSETGSLDDAAPATPEPRLSRGQKKRDAQALAVLGRQLTQFNRSIVLQLPLDEEVREAILLCQTLQKNAHARQLRRVAKLLGDSPVEPILKALRERKLLR